MTDTSLGGGRSSAACNEVLTAEGLWTNEKTTIKTAPTSAFPHSHLLRHGTPVSITGGTRKFFAEDVFLCRLTAHWKDSAQAPNLLERSKQIAARVTVVCEQCHVVSQRARTSGGKGDFQMSLPAGCRLFVDSSVVSCVIPSWQVLIFF
uniref:Uncharacterized protein n=1 Tax=Steinernema glaseri TaxID=37863 RepID=A0A1I8AB76_9BILA